MASKPFIAARIPESLNLKLEEHSKATGEGKTQVLINALSAYLDFAPESKGKDNASDRLSTLEKKVADLEKLINEPKQISLLETSPLIVKESTLSKIKADNEADNEKDQKIDPDITDQKVNPGIIKSDNTTDNSKPVETVEPIKTEQRELIDQLQQGRGKYVDRMKTQDIPNLPGLENENSKKMKVKLNNTKHAKTQATRIGNYDIVLATSADTTSNSKRQELFWDVYEIENWQAAES